MARYIDADELYKATQKRIAEANEARMAVVDDEFLDLIDDAFTEDVAPRAEIDKLQEVNADLNESLRLACEGNKDLQAEVDRLRFNLNAVLDERAEDKAEVAREIFEEIKDQLRGIFDFFRQDNDIRESCAIMFAISEVDKIEKKYTEPEPPKGD